MPLHHRRGTFALAFAWGRVSTGGCSSGLGHVTGSPLRRCRWSADWCAFLLLLFCSGVLVRHQASTGLYILETSGEKRELVQVSKRVCTWLYVMDEEGMMISVSGQGLVCVHDLNSLLVGPSEHIKFKTTKLIEDARGGQCAVTRTPDTGFTFLCACMTRCLILMQWYASFDIIFGPFVT